MYYQTVCRLEWYGVRSIRCDSRTKCVVGRSNIKTFVNIVWNPKNVRSFLTKWFIVKA